MDIITKIFSIIGIIAVCYIIITGIINGDMGRYLDAHAERCAQCTVHDDCYECIW